MFGESRGTAVGVCAADLPAMQRDDGVGAGPSAVESFFADMDYRKLASKRITFSLTSYCSPSFGFQVVFLAVVLGAVETASRWLMDISSPVPLFDVLDESRSVPFQACQCISAVLAGDSHVVWRASGWLNFRTFHREQPDLIDGMRHAAVAAATWVFLKMVTRFQKFPRRLAIVADVRRPMEVRTAVAQAFFLVSEHCLDPGFGLPLRRRLTSWRDLFNKRKQRLIYWWARTHKLHSLRAEATHAGDKKLITHSTDYMHFVSRALNQSSMRAIVREDPEDVISGESHDEEVAATPGPLHSLAMRWRNECRARRGDSLKATQQVDYDADWEALPEDHKQHYREYHSAELAKEVSARRASRTQALVPVQASSTSLARMIRGPGGDEVQVVNHVVGGGAVTKPRRHDAGKLLEHMPMTSESFCQTLASETKTVSSAAQWMDTHHTMPLARDNGAVGKVRYHRPCVGVCVQHKDRVSQIRRSMTSKMDQAMQGMLKASKNDAPELKTLFTVEKWCGGQKLFTEFLMPTAVLQNGNAEVWQRTLASIFFKPELDDGGERLDYNGVQCVMDRNIFFPRQAGVHTAPFSHGVDVGPLTFCLTKSWFADQVVNGDGAFRVTLGLTDLVWSSVFPDRIILRGRLPGVQSFDVDLTVQPAAKQRRGSKDDDEPDYSSIFAPKRDDDDSEQEDPGDHQPPLPPELLQEIFGDNPPAPASADFAPPFRSGDNVVEDSSEQDSSDMPSGDSCESSQHAENPQSLPATPCDWDRTLFDRDPRFVRVDTTVANLGGAVYEILGQEATQGRRLGTSKPIGVTSVKLQCAICKVSARGDMFYLCVACFCNSHKIKRT